MLGIKLKIILFSFHRYIIATPNILCLILVDYKKHIVQIRSWDIPNFLCKNCLIKCSILNIGNYFIRRYKDYFINLV